MPEGTNKMTCQALEAHQKGVQAVGTKCGVLIRWNGGMEWNGTSGTLAPVTGWYQC